MSRAVTSVSALSRAETMMAASRPYGGSKPSLTRLDLVIQEGVAIAGDDRLHHRMVGRIGLHEAAPDEARAPGTARDLMQKLECALGGARIGAMRQAEIAVDDADEGEARKVVTLGDDLRADDDVEFARLDAADDLAHFGQARDEIGRQQCDARIGKALRDFFLRRVRHRVRRRRARQVLRTSGISRATTARSRSGGTSAAS